MHLECLELCLGIYDEEVESLWIRIIQQTNMDGVAMSLTDCLVKKMKLMKSTQRSLLFTVSGY